MDSGQNNRMTAAALRAYAQEMRTIVLVGARAYGGRMPGVKYPIVRSHYTAGNARRYGWPPLSKDYKERKSGQTPELKADMRQRGAIVPAGKALPMLVATGTLRDTVSAGNARIAQVSPERATCTFVGLPEYAEYLREGTDTMPARSPVDPNAQDVEAVREVMLRHLRSRLPGGGSSTAGFGGGTPRVAVSKAAGKL